MPSTNVTEWHEQELWCCSLYKMVVGVRVLTTSMVTVNTEALTSVETERVGLWLTMFTKSPIQVYKFVQHSSCTITSTVKSLGFVTLSIHLSQLKAIFAFSPPSALNERRRVFLFVMKLLYF